MSQIHCHTEVVYDCHTEVVHDCRTDTVIQAQVSEALGLSAIKNREWSIFQTSATKGEGINESLDWLSLTLAGNK
jgi:hypothetical protein